MQLTIQCPHNECVNSFTLLIMLPFASTPSSAKLGIGNTANNKIVEIGDISCLVTDSNVFNSKPLDHRRSSLSLQQRLNSAVQSKSFASR